MTTLPTPALEAVTSGGNLITWSPDSGFAGPLAEMLNEDYARFPGQTFTPPAELAKAVLLEALPGVKITRFESAPLEPLPEGVLS